MKFTSHIIISIALFSIVANAAASAVPSAGACPRMNDSYRCVADQEFQTLIFRSDVVGGIQNYYINNVALVADGTPRTRVHADGRESIFTATCSPNKIQVFEATQINSAFCTGQKVQLNGTSNFTVVGAGFLQEEDLLLECPGKAPFRIRKSYQCQPAAGNP